MTYPTDPRVDAYIAALPPWQQIIANNRAGGWRKLKASASAALRSSS